MTKEITEKNNVAEVKKSRSPANQKLIDDFLAREKSKPQPPKIKVKNNAGKTTEISIDAEDRDLNIVSALKSFGTTSYEFQSYAMIELIDAACRGGKTKPYSEEEINGVLAAMHSINPNDEIEAMLASQMVATHFAAMRSMRALKNSDTVAAQDSNGNIAIKLMRTYTAQMEALNRYRGKGQQKMTVEHVHVYSGGQAIVGQVSNRKGGGAVTKTGEQPHAQ